MPGKSSFEYAVLRVVPRVDREEFVNVGVVLFSREHAFLGCAIEVDPARIRALAPDIDLEAVERSLASLQAVCDGGALASELTTTAERFHWLTSPKSTIVQTSPVHSGISEDPARELGHLLTTLVRAPQSEVDNRKSEIYTSASESDGTPRSENGPACSIRTSTRAPIRAGASRCTSFPVRVRPNGC